MKSPNPPKITIEQSYLKTDKGYFTIIMESVMGFCELKSDALPFPNHIPLTIKDAKKHLKNANIPFIVEQNKIIEAEFTDLPINSDNPPSQSP